MSHPSDDVAIEFLQEIVGIPSFSGQEAAVARAIVARLSSWGFESYIDQVGNAVGRLGAGSKRLLLLGHIDTVPGLIPVRREGDILYGRGSVDAKGPFAAFACAAARAGILPDLELILVGAVEEEAATSAGAYHVVHTYPQADWVIIGEPSRWDRITLGYKGRLLIDYTLRKEMGHTAGQRQGACEQAVDYWQAVRTWSDEYNRDKRHAFDTLDPSLRHIRSDSDGLCERVEMSIGLRLPPGIDQHALERFLLDAAGSAQVAFRGREQPFRAEKRNRLTSAFLASIRAHGGRPAFVLKTGTSDMNVIGPRWRCPIVAYGPGNAALDHTPHEHIALSDYLRSIRVLERVIRRLAGET